MTYLLVFILSLSGDGRPDEIFLFTPGIGGVPGYQNPNTVLEGPTSMTKEGAVTPFQPAYQQDQILSLGINGEIILYFDPPILNDFRNEFGIDFIVYGNSFSINNGESNPIFGQVASEGGCVEVSENGDFFYPLEMCYADGDLPTLAWSECEPFNDFNPKNLTDSRRPINLTVDEDSLIGNSWEEILKKYDQRAGGARYDLTEVNLEKVRFVRIYVPDSSLLTPEIDVVIDTLPPIPEDLNNDYTIGVLDLLLLLENWGSKSPGIFDINEDGIINILDLLQILEKWE